MQIHKMLVSLNTLERFEDGARLVFDRDMTLLDEGDALIARLANGDEHLLIVQKAMPDGWTAVHQTGAVSSSVRLELVDERALRVVLPAA